MECLDVDDCGVQIPKPKVGYDQYAGFKCKGNDR
jgi:hypothetical protein